MNSDALRGSTFRGWIFVTFDAAACSVGLHIALYGLSGHSVAVVNRYTAPIKEVIMLES